MRVLAFLVVLLSAAPVAAQITSPGHVHAVHSNLDGDDDCDNCHQSGAKVVASLCLKCHKDLGAEISAGRGLHGLQYKAKPCEECHIEHLGQSSRLIRWPGSGMEALDHGQTGWKLDGGHAKVTCLKCHTKRSPSSRTQFVGTSTACGSCHKDPHAGKFTSDCKKCHSLTEWKSFERKAFDHQLARYPLTGKHTTVACEKCHTGTPAKWKPLEFSTCETCHADPHKGQFKPQPCTGCHDTKSWEGSVDTIQKNHPKLSLANGHAKVACKTCHDKGNTKPPSKGGKCESCHRPIHLARFGNKCETCHASIQWVNLPEATGRANHDKTRYPLAGKHATSVSCAACHPRSKPVAQRFRNLPFDTCATCHPDKHAGEFKSRSNGECAQCHTLRGFAPTTFGLAEHATTAFAIDGKHLATPCGKCHTAKQPRLSWQVANKECASCHQNPHGEQFAKEMAAGGCAKCHTSLDWHEAKIDHTKWPLLGAHSRTPCTQCHGTQTKGAEPAAYRGIPRDCIGCHTDIHARQFIAAQPVKTCTSCHDTFQWKLGRKFDHKTTRYPLDGRHVDVACAKCHPATTLADGKTSVRWRLGYTACKDCHANPHVEAR